MAGHGLLSHIGDECVRFGLSEPIHVQVVGIDSMALLNHLLELVESFEPITDEEKKALIEKVKDYNKPEQLWWRSGQVPQEIIDFNKKSAAD